jgi:hypothetical protein
MEYAVLVLRLASCFALEVQYVQRILWIYYLSLFHHS